MTPNLFAQAERQRQGARPLTPAWLERQAARAPTNELGPHSTKATCSPQNLCKGRFMSTEAFREALTPLLAELEASANAHDTRVPSRRSRHDYLSDFRAESSARRGSYRADARLFGAMAQAE